MGFSGFAREEWRWGTNREGSCCVLEERWGKRRGSVEKEERMSGCLLLARKGGREVLGSAGKMEIGVVAWFRPVEKIRFRFFFSFVVALKFSL
jgi:hypothetical protein